ncbi:MAG TPA: hypothetical protein DCE41_25590 [Cytophagales bacterium]|nr:hypothetical protein [Cytophagales bacterium]HAA19913.1 hypothetical protein [Cytophagales bacterium]HAP62660.1 hypothetical protein [Cytophagales bacterium]
MPFTIKNDVVRKYKLKGKFRLKRDIKAVKQRSFVKSVIEDMADQSYNDFHNSWDIDMPKRNVAREVAHKFNLDQDEREVAHNLWPIIKEARAYDKKMEDEIEDDLGKGYQILADLAARKDSNAVTLDRVVDRSDERFVVFSDHHMTAFERKPNYFKDFNWKLYEEVLQHYATTDYCLVENGDVEECIIFEPTLSSSRTTELKAKKGKLPISLDDPDWEDYLEFRYMNRRLTLDRIIWEFRSYYRILKSDFIDRDKYVKLSGNHDTYLDEPYERDLKNRIEEELGTKVYDVLRIDRGGSQPKYLILHGHQFDAVTLQHGEIPFAKSLGEVYSENLSWGYEGPDRVWRTKDTTRYINGASFNNSLAREVPSDFGDASAALAIKNFVSMHYIKKNPKGFVEKLLKHEIAWEYFENDNAYYAFALEVLKGDEMYKIRHLNENSLVHRYIESYRAQDSVSSSTSLRNIPKVIIGHTHEVRQDASSSSELSLPGEGAVYLNSGSAGRFQNLIWCIEIDGDVERIISWSGVDKKLKKITWEQEGDRLVHKKVDWY